MKTTRRIKALIESEQVFVITRRERVIASRREKCDCPAEMTTPEAAAAIAGLSVREICRLVEAGKLHFLETNDGLLLICLNSLAQETGRVYYGTIQAPS